MEALFQRIALVQNPLLLLHKLIKSPSAQTLYICRVQYIRRMTSIVILRLHRTLPLHKWGLNG